MIGEGEFDLAELDRWINNFFRIGMGPEVGGFPSLPGDEPPDRNHLFFSMVRHFGQAVRPVMMYHHVWTIH
jgi:hypothetical protein